ncbi:adenine-specific DNA-methyltransferase [Gelidibacter sediminis]|uniref:site-specific DNA-methyltransferase (adenine-specific) n=1 Tax=Gelidibacter sediminis TaxID=1608710 RepID=A0A4R7PZG7_9FLAO|nr:site-specific DNA-methyltransferase [Gelidibacter sediminis]TDU40418.1 adenine-specific DNA-methyltransferase [Gelidibacter sediminis]
MDGKSLTPQEIKLQELKNIFPEVFAEDKVDWEKLKATLGEDINFSNERYVLNWAGKSDAFKVLQSPTTKTLIPVKDESENFDETENIFIEGENLEVLKVLQKSYFGKVKMIYIDPPYNTGNDHFIYPDKFSETKKDYEKRVGDKDEEGYMTKDGMFKKNSKENGQYHSNWMNMMYPRLFLAKNLLKQDGVIFISIDDNEVHNLIMMMNEVFGEENFIASIAVQLNPRGRNLDKFIAKTHEYIVVYAKNADEESTMIGLEKEGKMISDYNRDDNDGKGAYRLIGLRNRNQAFNPVTRPKLYYPLYANPKTNKVSLERDEDYSIELWPDTAEGTKTCWTWGKIKVNAENDLLLAEPMGDGWRIFRKDYLLDENGEKARTLPKSIWVDKNINNDYGKKSIKELFGANVMSFPKSPHLIKKCMQFSTDDNSIIMDFFSGSGTLAESVYELNNEDGGKRKYICVQLPEKLEEGSKAFESGFKTIADVAKSRIRKVGEKISEALDREKDKLKSEIPFEDISLKSKPDLGFKILKLSDSNFKQWQQIQNKDVQALEDQMKLFVDPVAENATIENMVYELMLKSGKDLNSKIVHKNGFYIINENELILLLEKVDQKIIDNIIVCKPNKVVALDKLFKDNDQLKTNTVLQMKDAGIEFKTI